jgi:hypothetical protein
MAVKVVKMVTGEQVIADIVDMKDENGRNVGFKLTYPYTLVMRQTEDMKFDINYLAWMSASSTVEFAVPYSSVITIGDAAKEVTEEYLKQFGELLTELEQ